MLTPVPGQVIKLDFTAADLRTPEQRAVHGYWLEARGEAPFPPSEAIDPLRLPKSALPMIGYMEPVEPDDFVIRVAGTGIRDAVGIEFTGRKISALPGAEGALERFLWCQREGRPYFTEGPIAWANQHYRIYSVLALPYGSGTRVTRIMLVFGFERP